MDRPEEQADLHLVPRRQVSHAPGDQPAQRRRAEVEGQGRQNRRRARRASAIAGASDHLAFGRRGKILMYEALVAIAAFDKADLRRDLQPDAGWPKAPSLPSQATRHCAVTSVSGASMLMAHLFLAVFQRRYARPPATGQGHPVSRGRKVWRVYPKQSGLFQHPPQRPSTEDMHVVMWYFLHPVLASIRDRPITRPVRHRATPRSAADAGRDTVEIGDFGV